MPRKPKIDIISILGENAAVSDGHFELPCGLHIQSYVDTSVIMQYPSIASKIARALADLFDKKIDVVFSATAENSIIAQEVARVKRARSIFAIMENGVMKLKGGMTIRPSENVLIVDNVTMTGRKVKEAAGLVKLLNANPVGVAVIVDRSSGGAIGNLPLRSLLSYPLDTYHSDDCPLCKAGVKLTKAGQNK
jgi:orotate phosphoribosyltransferase